jgi:hypothetical protein
MTVPTDFLPGTYENHGTLYPIPVTFKVSDYELVCTIINAIEGGPYGIDYWCELVELTATDVKVIEWDAVAEVWNEYIARNVALGGSLTFYEMADADDSRKDAPTPHVLTREKLLKAYAMIFEQGLFRDRFQGITESGEANIDGDAPMADSLIQLALFGECRYC